MGNLRDSLVPHTWMRRADGEKLKEIITRPCSTTARTFLNRPPSLAESPREVLRRGTMKREILINAAPRETRIAILEDGKLVELLVDRPDNRRMVGDIYLGRVDAVLPGIQAAFVDIGTEKSAFLHASDLVRETAEEAEDEDDDDEQTDEPVEKKNGNNGNGRRAKAPLIQEALKRGQEILVQVPKEPISTKGPRVTA